MNKEEITYKIPNNQIHISEKKDEDCLIWISPKALYMANTIDKLQQENQELKKQLTTYKILHRDCKVDNLKKISKIEEKENQQKEFINCLEDEYTKIQSEIEKETNNNAKYFKIERRQTITGILQKYKEIIGDDK